MLLMSISNWDLPDTMWSTYTNTTHKSTEGFTSRPGRPLSGLSHASPNLTRGWRTITSSLQGRDMMVFIAQFERECQVGYLRVRFISKRLRFSNPNHIIVSRWFCCLLVKEFDFLTVFYFLAMFANKNQVASWLNFTNVAALNFILRSEIFVSEDGQLWAVHMILEVKPISKIFQEIGHAIRAGDPRLARINVSKSDFLARDDLPPVELPIRQNPPPFAIPLQQVPPKQLQ